MASLDADSWQSAILEEYQSIQEAGTCTMHDMSDLPAGRQPVGSEWVSKVKHNAHGSIERYKARIVAKGHSQIEGLDYDETFAPVMRCDSIRLSIAVPTHRSHDTDLLDIKSEFLHVDLLAEVRMIPTPGIGLHGKMLRLHKGLYSPKGAPLTVVPEDLGRTC